MISWSGQGKVGILRAFLESVECNSLQFSTARGQNKDTEHEDEGTGMLRRVTSR